MDEDQSGTVSHREFRRATSLLGMGFTREQVNELYASFDRDGDVCRTVRTQNSRLSEPPFSMPLTLSGSALVQGDVSLKELAKAFRPHARPEKEKKKQVREVEAEQVVSSDDVRREVLAGFDSLRTETEERQADVLADMLGSPRRTSVHLGAGAKRLQKSVRRVKELNSTNRSAVADFFG